MKAGSNLASDLTCSISTEFLALMKKVSKSPLVMDVLNIQGVQRSLERLADLLGKIQKALGEYLERERSSFPRWGASQAQTEGRPSSVLSSLLACELLTLTSRVLLPVIHLMNTVSLSSIDSS